MSHTTDDTLANPQDRGTTAGKHLDALGWALFFLMLGGLGLVPGETVPEGTWLLGTGLIMIGVQAARALMGLGTVGSSLFFGALALGIGICAVFAVSLPVFPILLVLLGLHMVLQTVRQHARGTTGHSAA